MYVIFCLFCFILFIILFLVYFLFFVKVEIVFGEKVNYVGEKKIYCIVGEKYFVFFFYVNDEGVFIGFSIDMFN